MNTRPKCRRCGFSMYTHKETPIPGMVRASGRGLCNSCHSCIRKRGQLHLYSRVTRANADVVEDTEFLQRERGMTLTQIAERLGYKSRDSLTRALLRYRQRKEAA